MKRYTKLFTILTIICHSASIHNHTPNTITVHAAKDCLSINAEDSFELSSQESIFIPEEVMPQMCILIKYDLHNSMAMKMIRTTNQDQAKIFVKNENNQTVIELAQN